jgi:hypothetical protein
LIEPLAQIFWSRNGVCFVRGHGVESESWVVQTFPVIMNPRELWGRSVIGVEKKLIELEVGR